MTMQAKLDLLAKVQEMLQRDISEKYVGNFEKLELFKEVTECLTTAVNQRTQELEAIALCDKVETIIDEGEYDSFKFKIGQEVVIKKLERTGTIIDKTFDLLDGPVYKLSCVNGWVSEDSLLDPSFKFKIGQEVVVEAQDRADVVIDAFIHENEQIYMLRDSPEIFVACIR